MSFARLTTSVCFALAAIGAVSAQSTIVDPVPPAQPTGAPAAPAPGGNGAAGYPNMPTVFPPIDQTVMIPDNLLQHPLVAEGMRKVQAAVPASLLNLPVAKYVGTPTPEYPGGAAAAAANCYWPAGQCVRDVAAQGYNADVSKCPNQNDWGITYDDGPTVAPTGQFDTEDIRTALTDLNNAKATFFVCGTNAIAFPDELKKSFDAGHEIAVHTWTHHPLTSLTNQQIVAEILYTEAQIYKVIGRKPRFFRPPYGDIDDRVRAVASALGYTAIIWTAPRDTEDTTAQGADGVNKILNTARSWFQAQPGFISLEHDISTTTSEIAVKLLQSIKAAGPGFPLKIMPVGTCLGTSAYADGLAPAPNTTTLPAATTTAVPAPRTQSPPTATTAPRTGASGEKSLAVSIQPGAWVGALVMGVLAVL
ncbi:uncharacterized protein SPPG_08491 [Spizellomyces punctatus DAOM BR117]|uniref:NodB homology domain-containing protein n=1 Tax=Spizellomyces punctatus (strain DAOM BR117) TaxID=645134 RepID=A0A0L0H4I7_SPIPD|nr:uncharacterized protein SPPG_08491 [Spizellomyces punctatus DAOM BR117]KNC96102.1 hypothetical protein SPPG_08491 [Spizellomyces punctatus DAOM BR117]|eukprot:XP_016604142.1 hypothetical protein SPPG_08491 [Spizellomyces punctatus DAOM BR117]